MPAAVIDVVPPVRRTVPVMFAALVTAPPDCIRLVALPPVRFAWPLFTTRALSVPAEVRLPPEFTYVIPLMIPVAVTAVVPPLKLATPILPLFVTVPLPCVRLVAVPPVKLAWPPYTFKA